MTNSTFVQEPPVRPVPIRRTPHDPWGVLERFGQDLHRCAEHEEQVRLLLRAARELVNADVVFVWQGEQAQVGEVVGARGGTAAWGGGLVARLLEQTPLSQNQVLVSDLPPGGKGEESPRSAALLRLSKSRQLWLVAVSFDPAHLFQVGDVNWLSLGRQMLTRHAQHLRVYAQLKETVLGLVHSFTMAIDAKDRYTRGHSERVARIAVRLGQEMGLPAGLVSDIYLAGLLHDVGKIGIRDSVLLKPFELTAEEWAHVKEHPVLGERIVASVKQLAHLCPGVRNHHERWDGKGYPDGLACEAIPLMARVLAVADSCDAMMSDRPYRSSMPGTQIDLVLQRGAGQQWDPAVIAAFERCRDDLYAICAKGIGQSVLQAVDDAVEANRFVLEQEMA